MRINRTTLELIQADITTLDVILATIIDHCRHATGLTRVVMCLYDAPALATFQTALADLMATDP